MIDQQRCPLCNASTTRSQHENRLLCSGCFDQLPWLAAKCQRCAVPLPAAGTATETLCVDCQQAEPSFQVIRAAWSYDQPVRQMITRFKYHQDLAYGRLMAALFGQWYRDQSLDLPQYLIPVPLHRNRLRERGFNQSLELTRFLSRELGCAVQTDSLRRVIDTEHQSELPAARRRTNVRKAFQCDGLQADHVAVIDDVVTTGHTANEIARVLTQAGVSKVEIWTMARAAPPPANSVTLPAQVRK